jgi:hypothetical protein
MRNVDGPDQYAPARDVYPVNLVVLQLRSCRSGTPARHDQDWRTRRAEWHSARGRRRIDPTGGMAFRPTGPAACHCWLAQQRGRHRWTSQQWHPEPTDKFKLDRPLVVCQTRHWLFTFSFPSSGLGTQFLAGPSKRRNWSGIDPRHVDRILVCRALAATLVSKATLHRRACRTLRAAFGRASAARSATRL